MINKMKNIGIVRGWSVIWRKRMFRQEVWKGFCAELFLSRNLNEERI